MFKFVNTDASNPGKRKSLRACEVCRKRKRRCIHIDAASVGASGTSSTDPNSLRSPAADGSQVVPGDRQTSPDLGQSRALAGAEQFPTPGSAEPVTSIVDESHRNETCSYTTTSPSINSRFIGDLNPEGIFLAAAHPDAARDASSKDGVGVWLAKELTKKDLQPIPELLGLFHESGSLTAKALASVLREESLSTIPPQTHLSALSNLYFEKMHPILPIIDANAFQNLPTTDPRRVVLQQGICLAASKLFASRRHLILPGSESPLMSREFSSRLSAAMKLIIEMGLITDKIFLIQALALMAHFASGPESGDVASQHLSRAVQHVFSLGLHHIRDQHQTGADQNNITLFWCIWALDRMNAAFHGRPVMMHDRDIGRSLEQCFELQQPAFRLLLEVTSLLDKVIGLYRPSHSTDNSRAELEFPSFEESVARCSGSHIATSLLATLETFYHAVAMLSYRSNTWENPQRSSPSYLRQSLASSRISSTNEYEARDQLILFPFIPYAFSLSLSVAYREMRYNRIPMSRARARSQFQNNCEFLSKLGEIFWSASTMAEMGKSTLKEMDRVYSVVAVSGQRKLQPDAGNGESSNDGFSSGADLRNDAGNHENTALATQPQEQGMPDFDSSVFDSISDLDLFGMFDPSFDLNSIDACLEGNLDLSFPTVLQ